MVDELDLRLQFADRGLSLNFNGTSDYTSCNYIPAAAGFNIACWVKPVPKNSVQEAQTGSSGMIAYSEDFSPTKGIHLLYGSNQGQQNIYAQIADGVGNGYNIGSVQIPNDWLHIAFTYQLNLIENLYVNGIRVQRYLSDSDPQGYITEPDPQYISMGVSAQGNITFGKNVDLNGSRFKGRLCNLVLQNGNAWTENQVVDLYTRNVIPPGSVWYNFENNVVDQSGQGYDMTLNGTTYSLDIPVGNREGSDNG